MVLSALLIEKVHGLAPPMNPEFIGSEALGINNTGKDPTVVGKAMAASLGEAAMLWDPGPVLMAPSAESSKAVAINDSNDIVGVLDKPGGATRGFLYRNGNMTDLSGVLGGQMSGASDINNSGLIAVWAGNENYHAMVFDSINQGSPTDLGVLPNHDRSAATAINNNGHSVGFSIRVDPASIRLFMHDGSMHDLGSCLTAGDINDAGQIVGSRLIGNGVTGAYICETSTGYPQFQTIPFLPGFFWQAALSVNNNGDVVGIAAADPYTWHAFRKIAGEQIEDLNDLLPTDSGWELHIAHAINDDGAIVGIGTYQGEARGFILKRSARSLGGPWVVSDPLANVISSSLYAKLKLPNPQPLRRDIAKAQIRASVEPMSRDEKQEALEWAKVFIDVLESE